MKALKAYMKNHPDLAKADLMKSRLKATTLKKVTKQHAMKGYNRNGELLRQNHYISFRSYKYHLMLLEAMNQLETDQLQGLIDQTLIRVERPERPIDQAETLYDLFEHWKKEIALAANS